MRKLRNLKIDELICYIIIFAACLKLPNALQDIGNAVYMIALVASFFYLFWKMLWKRELLKNVYHTWGIVLVILFLISAAANHGLFIVRNLRACICGILFFFILVPCAGIWSKEAAGEKIHKVNMIIITSTMIYGIIMLFFTIFRGHFYLINYSGSMIRIGWNVGRNMGIYAEGNLAGYASVLSFAVGLVELVFLKSENMSSRKTKIFVWANQIIQSVCVVVSCSRTAYLVTLVILFVYVYVWAKVTGRKRRLLQGVGICVLGGGYIVNYWFDDKLTSRYHYKAIFDKPAGKFF